MPTRLQLLAGLVASLVGSTASAEVSDSVWTALRNHSIVVQRADGTETGGQLLDANATSIVLMGADGRVVEVPKAEVASVRGETATAPEAAPASEAADALPEAKLAALVRYTPATRLDALVRGDPRFRALDPDARARLVESTRERRAGLAIALNCVVGFGVGSFVQGDSEAGTNMLLLDLAGTTAFIAGYAMIIDSAIDDDSPSPGGGALLLAGTGIFVANRIYGIVHPFHFNGRKYKILQEALGSEELHASFFVVPDPVAGGMRGGLAVRF